MIWDLELASVKGVDFQPTMPNCSRKKRIKNKRKNTKLESSKLLG